MTSWRETQGEADPVVLPLHAELAVDDRDPVHVELDADVFILERLVAHVEHQVCLVWTYKADLGVRCGHLRVWGRVFATAAGRQRARGESKSDGNCGRGAHGHEYPTSAAASPLL
ncbi:hypothetical protein BN11_40014 [Nostocoides australiense Ben110]|uniref:Uncharacterized protein n=1 Tax=Nostocoides australiense Ben110 TaxID=1193182 RepID=W6JZM0_9MICO|nr:hypothetical protein BN11_40014 [Tetrasphaera australiensis Ben110]